jgi:hypothetical protein
LRSLPHEKELRSGIPRVRITFGFPSTVDGEAGAKVSWLAEPQIRGEVRRAEERTAGTAVIRGDHEDEA